MGVGGGGRAEGFLEELVLISVPVWPPAWQPRSPSSGARHVLGVFVRMAQRARGASLLRDPRQLAASASAPGPWLAPAERQRAQRRGTRAPGPAPHLPGVSVRNARGKRTFIEHLLGAGAGAGRARQTQARPVQEKEARCFGARLPGRRLNCLWCEASAVGTAHPGAPGLPRPWSEPTAETAGRWAGTGQQAVQPQAGEAAGAAAGSKALDVRPSAPAHVICLLPGLSLGWEHILSSGSAQSYWVYP